MKTKKNENMQQCLIVFDNAIKSEATRKAYLYQLELFRKWMKVKDYDGLLMPSEKEIQIVLEDYLFYLKKRVSHNTIPTVIVPLELFYSMNDKILDFKKLRKMFSAEVKRGGYGAYTTEDVQKMLKRSSKKRSRAILLFMCSTGCRIGAIPSMKQKNVTEMQMGANASYFTRAVTKNITIF
jgi:integrase/recombinase XerD